MKTKNSSSPKKKANEIKVQFIGLSVLHEKHGLTKRTIAETIGMSEVALTSLTRLGGPIMINMETFAKILGSGILEKYDMKFTDLFSGIPEHLKG